MQVPFVSHGPPPHFGSLLFPAVHLRFLSSTRSRAGHVSSRSLSQVPVWQTEEVVLHTIPAPAAFGSFTVPRKTVENFGIVAPLVAVGLGPTSLNSHKNDPACAAMTDWVVPFFCPLL